MLIEIVTHCYASQLPHYADALVYQISSLVLDKPKNCRVMLTVCFCPGDQWTQTVLLWGNGVLGRDLTAIPLDIRSLGRRAIGRNKAAKTTPADIVWFADVDQCFREGILTRLAGMAWPEGAVMIYPRQIMIHKDHATGDRATALVEGHPRIIDINPNEFIPKRYNRAIGGVQIVKGDYCRKYGYLDGDEKWMKPTNGNFVSCTCDRAFRSNCRKVGKTPGVELPGLYRIRHTEAAHGRTPKL